MTIEQRRNRISKMSQQIEELNLLMEMESAQLEYEMIREEIERQDNTLIEEFLQLASKYKFPCSWVTFHAFLASQYPHLNKVPGRYDFEKYMSHKVVELQNQVWRDSK